MKIKDITTEVFNRNKNLHNKINKMKEVEMQFENATGTKIGEHEISQVNEQYMDTPIWIRGNEEVGYFATLGDHRITEPHKSLAQAEEDLQFLNWNVILNAISSMILAAIKIKDEENKRNNI